MALLHPPMPILAWPLLATAAIASLAVRSASLPLPSAIESLRSAGLGWSGFVRSEGRLVQGSAFYTQDGGSVLYFDSAGVTHQLPTGARESSGAWNLRIGFAGARPVQPEAEGTSHRVAWFHRGRTRSGARPAFSGVRYRGLWPGIDLVYQAAGSSLKYDLHVAPGADPGAIRFECRGASSARIDAEGRLRLTAGADELVDDTPVAYQVIAGKKVAVPARFRLQTVRPGVFQYGFQLGHYDPTLPLVIDPALLRSCDYLGYGRAAGIALGSGGEIYLCGETSAPPTEVPLTVGPDLTHNGGETEAFVARLRLTQGGQFAVEYFGYLGGDGYDSAKGIAVDAEGCAYLVGETNSREDSFPVLVGPDLTFNGTRRYTPSSTGDAWIAKVTPDGSSLRYCGYLGGSEPDEATGVAVDELGRAYVSGRTTSPSSSFPATVGPVLSLTVAEGGELPRPDGFIARVAPDGSALEYCGYIGGTGEDVANAVAVDRDGRAYVAGSGHSGSPTFPAVVGPELVGYPSYPDAWVARVRADGTGFEYCGFIAGYYGEAITSIAVDGEERAYVGGWTRSPETTFPERVGPVLRSRGRADAFVARVAPDGTRLEYCGYISGKGADAITSVAVDAQDRLVVAGETGSDERSFPVRGGPDLRFNGGGVDGFVARVSADGRKLDYCGYLGGTSRLDSAAAVAAAPAGEIFVAGFTNSPPQSFPVRNAARADRGGGIFVAQLSWRDEGAPPEREARIFISPSRLNFGQVRAGTQRTLTLRIRNRGRGPGRVDVPALPAPFSTEPGELSVAPGETKLVRVTLEPLKPGRYETGLALTTPDDPGSPLIHVPVRATAERSGQ
ncbi:MAG: SBBP repeat-containing protein [Armatimonadota bacterium]